MHTLKSIWYQARFNQIFSSIEADNNNKWKHSKNAPCFQHELRHKAGNKKVYSFWEKIGPVKSVEAIQLLLEKIPILLLKRMDNEQRRVGVDNTK